MRRGRSVGRLSRRHHPGQVRREGMGGISDTAISELMRLSREPPTPSRPTMAKSQDRYGCWVRLPLGGTALAGTTACPERGDGEEFDSALKGGQEKNPTDAEHRAATVAAAVSEKVVRPGGFEPPTFWSVARRSIQTELWAHHATAGPSSPSSDRPDRRIIVSNSIAPGCREPSLESSRIRVRWRWQLAQTISHFAASSTSCLCPRRAASLTLNSFSPRTWSNSIAHGGKKPLQSAHGTAFHSLRYSRVR